MSSKVNFNEFDFASIRNATEQFMLSTALHKSIWAISGNTTIEEFIESFFAIPEHPSGDYQHFFDNLSSILFLDKEKNRYEFLNKSVKERIINEALDYYHHLSAKYG